MSFNKIHRRAEHPRRADQSAVCAINRHLQCVRINLLKFIIGPPCARPNLSLIFKVYFKSRGSKNTWKNSPLAKWPNKQAYTHQPYATTKASKSYQHHAASTGAGCTTPACSIDWLSSKWRSEPALQYLRSGPCSMVSPRRHLPRLVGKRSPSRKSPR